MRRIISIICALVLAATFQATAQQRYCNPLPMPIGEGGYAGGDVSVIEYEGTYYLCCTGGGIWYSKDFLNWTYEKVDKVPTSPDIARYNGKFYLSSYNETNLYVADHPMGPYRDLGPFKNTGTVDDGWNGAFDPQIFIDDDNTPYMFWGGRGISGIYGVRLDPDDLTRFAEKPTHLFGFNPMHSWERYGEAGEYPGVAWIEGPWVIKRNGIYYLEYSASGTQWNSYAEGYYTATSPLGPYTYAPNNPLLRKTEGLVRGTGHGSIVKGPDGNLWQFYTIVLSSPTGGRRIGMDRVEFDENGLMSVKITDTPQPAPGVSLPKDRPASIPLTINKFNAMNALSKASSARDGYPAAFAVDNYTGTVWRPAADDPQPSITIELSPATRFDIVQHFTVDGMRVMFNGARGTIFGPKVPPVYKYRLEVSQDGENFTEVVDNTHNTVPRDTFYDDFSPVNCRFVRLTVTGWPEEDPLGIIDFTVFGYADGYDLPAVATPVFSALPLDR